MGWEMLGRELALLCNIRCPYCHSLYMNISKQEDTVIECNIKWLYMNLSKLDGTVIECNYKC
jgi:hypothetical protein